MVKNSFHRVKRGRNRVGRGRSTSKVEKGTVHPLLKNLTNRKENYRL